MQKKDKTDADENQENQNEDKNLKDNDLSYLGMGRIIDIKR